METPPPVAKTCEPCAKAKIRCTKRSGDSLTCERCERLKKECTYRLARRRNNGTRKDKRIEALEAKFNQLLEAQKPSQSRPVSPFQSGSRVENSASVESSTQLHYSPLSTPADHATTPERLQPSLILRREASSDVISSGLVPIETARLLLENFRTTMTSHFPFVLIEPGMSIEKLRAEKPFLLLTILEAASFEDFHIQKALEDEVKQIICTRVILRGEVSLEVLQGLLVHTAWCQYHSKPRMSMQFLSLAISMVICLRIDQPPQKQSWKTPLKFNSYGVDNPEPRVGWSPDEQRAVAGCFYLCSSSSLILQKTSIFQYSAYMERCCTYISAKEEYPSDKYILYIVQLQHISEKIDQLYSRHGPQLNDPDASLELLISSLQSELSIYKDRLPFEMNENSLLSLQFHTAELHLYQLALNQDAQTKEQPRIRSPWQLKIIRLGLQAAKDMFDYYMTLPSSIELTFSNLQWIQVGFSLLVSSRLCVLAGNHFNQETEALRRSLGMLDVIRQMISRLQVIRKKVEGVNSDKHMLWQYEIRGQMVQKWLEEHSRDKPVFPIDRNSSENETYQSMGQYLPQQFGELSTLDQDISLMDPQLLAGGIFDLQTGAYFPDTMEGLMGDVSKSIKLILLMH